MKYREKVVDTTTVRDAVGYIGPYPSEFSVRGTNDTAAVFNDAIMGRHVLYLGGIGTGKTVGISALVSSIREGMSDDDVMVVFDTKGDYYDMFYTHGDAVLSSSVSEFKGEVVWNIFEEFRQLPLGRQIEDEIFELCNGLFSGTLEGAGDNIYFAQAARDVFVALITAIYRESGPTSNEDIRKIVGGMSPAEMREMFNQPGNEDLRGASHYIAKDDSNSARAVMAFMQQVIAESFRSAFGRPGAFSIREFIRGKSKRALFIEYDIAAGGMLAPVFKTMIDIAMKEAMSRKRPAGRVFFVLDEFALLPELNHLSNGLNFGRSLGLRFIVGAQDVNQVVDMYGPDKAASVLSAFGTVFSFRLYDSESRIFVRDRFGENRKIASFEPSGWGRGAVETRVIGNVVEDWDLSALTVGTCIAALPDHEPMRFTFAFDG